MYEVILMMMLTAPDVTAIEVKNIGEGNLFQIGKAQAKCEKMVKEYKELKTDFRVIKDYKCMTLLKG